MGLGDEHLRRVLDNLTAFVGVLTPDGTVVEVNGAPLKAGGIPASEVLGKKAWDCYWFSFSAESQERLREVIERAACGATVRYDALVRMAGDTRRWIDFQLAPVRDERGRITHLIPYAIDITAHKQAEERLRESEERLRFALHSAVAGAWDWDIRSGAIVCSEENYALYGLDPAKRPMSYVDWEARAHPGDRSRANRAVQEALSGRSAEFRLELRVVPAPAVVRWLLELGRVERAPDGSPVRMSGISLDITDRKRTEMLLAEQTALLETLASKAPIGLAFVDRKCRYVRVNDMLAQLNGVSAHDHIGRTVEAVVPHLWPTVGPLYRQALSGEPVVNVEISQDGAEAQHEAYHRLVSYYPVRVDGRIRGVGVVIVDITTQKRTEALLKDADRRKDEFLATLAHELRNPLAPIRNAVHILNLQSPRDAASQAARDIIERQLRQMVRLVDDLLDVSRITRGKLELRRERVALATIMEQALEGSMPHIDRSEHEVTVSWPASAVYLDADAVRLAQVFSNLLNNACKYTQKGGRIRMAAERDRAEAVVRITDNGIGISSEHLPHVFDMFSQVNPSLEQTQDGLGIGLSLAKGLVEMHGGSIEATSEGAGKGSEFIVRLPVLAEGATSSPAIPGLRGSVKAATRRRILVVDDNRDSTQSLAALLRLDENVVETAYDGIEAVKKAEEYQPDLILLDLGMPKMNGYEACRAIRAQPCGKSVVLIALTGWGQQEDRRKSKEAGFDGHLVKPVEPKDLMNLLASLHEQRTVSPKP